MKKRKYRYFVSDFETTVYKGQTHTEVWASASVELFSEKVVIHQSIEETLDFYKSLKCNIVAYFHNLKFDGSFWLDYLLNTLKLEQAYEELDENTVRFLNEKEMKNNTFKYTISEMGQWYTFTIKTGGYFIEIRDSLKLLPFSVARIGQSFKTKHQKLDMEYKGFRYSGCEITEEERKYIANDVLVVKEGLEIMHNEGHLSLTIGSCCLEEYKKIVGKDEYESLFPNMEEIELDPLLYGQPNADLYIRKSYRGGWCYLVKGKEGQVYKNGTTADVNSLYPSVMSSESGNRYPMGNPVFWKGNFIPDKALGYNKYYFIRIKTRFYLKDGKLPFIQIKNSFLYRGNECLETSDIYNHVTEEYSTEYIDKKGNVVQAIPTLTLTMVDFELLKEHYELVDFEILDGCWFFSEIGLFDAYIEKYKKIKMESTGAVRELAKLFLNNLYGKMASSTDSSFKVAFINDKGLISFKNVTANDKKIGYIPVGSAITSYAKNFTIRGAQANYYGKDKRGFIYADTDSVHCDLEPHELKELRIHDVNFNSWSLESQWDEAIFVRQKTYIEHLVVKDGKPCKPKYDIKCAGMPQRCKNIFEMSLREYDESELDQFDDEVREFAKKFADEKKTIQDFKIGLQLHGKLMPKRISGGIVLVDTTYVMR